MIADPRPRALDVLAEGIPAALRAVPQWVVWRYTRRKGKWTKPPFNAASGLPADSTDPSTWAPFEDTLDAYERGGWDGVGFVPTPDDGLAVIDLDHVREAETCHLDPKAAGIVAEMDTYSEVSPSGTGLRIVCHARKPDRERSKTGNVEIYDGLTSDGKAGGKYLTFTGHKLEGSPGDIRDRQDQLTRVYERELLGGRKKAEAPGRPGAAGPDGHANGTGHLGDDDVLRRASRAKNGGKFRRLWAGDTSGHGDDDSRADAALCALLAFWTRKDAAQMDRLFRRSGLMRPKWDERRGEKTYGQATVAHAIEQCAEVYQPRPRAKAKSDAASLSPNGRPPDDGEPTGESDDGASSGYSIIRKYFGDYYQPAFRRGTAAYSQSFGREVKLGEACCAPGIVLCTALKAAANAPRQRGGEVDINALPHFFQTWAKTAWKDVLDELPEEQEAEVLVGVAEEEFRGRVAATLLTHVNLGKRYDTRAGEGTETQRRTLIDWCRVFAKPGKWADVRGYQVWCRSEPDGKLLVAVRRELFGQLQGFADLAGLSATKFTQLMERYRVGEGDRVRGARAVVLTDDFVGYLLARPCDTLTDPGDSRTRTRETECQIVNNDANADTQGG
jgi:hypothetical protein